MRGLARDALILKRWPEVDDGDRNFMRGIITRDG